MRRISFQPISWVALLAVCCDLPQATTALTTSEESRPAFFVLSREGEQLHLHRYEQQGTRFTRAADTALQRPSKPVSPDVFSSSLYVLKAVFSPDRKWLAVGLSPTGFGLGALASHDLLRIRVFVVASGRLAYDGPKISGQWFGWRDENTLCVQRYADAPSGSPLESATFTLSGPDWQHSEHRSALQREDVEPVDEQAEARCKQAAFRLTQRGYAMRYVTSVETIAPTSNESWEYGGKLTGHTGAVSEDGTTIATLVTSGPEGRELSSARFILLRESSGWKEEVLPERRRIEGVRFWRDYLVLQTSDKQREHFYVTLWKLKDLSKTLEVSADAFPP